MFTKKRTIIFVLTLGFLAVLPGVFLVRQAKSMERVPYQSVSIIQLIADPEKYDGKRVQFIGYARVAFENDYIYLSPEDDQYGIVDNGIYIRIKTRAKMEEYQDKDRKYAIICDTFNADNKSIDNITRFDVWANPDETSSQKK